MPFERFSVTRALSIRISRFTRMHAGRICTADETNSMYPLNLSHEIQGANFCGSFLNTFAKHQPAAEGKDLERRLVSHVLYKLDGHAGIKSE